MLSVEYQHTTQWRLIATFCMTTRAHGTGKCCLFVCSPLISWRGAKSSRNDTSVSAAAVDLRFRANAARNRFSLPSFVNVCFLIELRRHPHRHAFHPERCLHRRRGAASVMNATHISFIGWCKEWLRERARCGCSAAARLLSSRRHGRKAFAFALYVAPLQSASRQLTTTGSRSVPNRQPP